MKPIETVRLILREWTDADLAPFAALNADLEVMRFFPATLAREQSDALVDSIRAHAAQHGFGPWVAVRRDTGDFLGAIGLSIPTFQTAFTPCVEVAWRLARPYWGQGYAPEAARAALHFGFTELKLGEIVAFTSLLNRPSIRVMQKIGMTTDTKEEFDHPKVPKGHRLQRHVLYRINRAAFTTAHRGLDGC